LDGFERLVKVDEQLESSSVGCLEPLAGLGRRGGFDAVLPPNHRAGFYFVDHLNLPSMTEASIGLSTSVRSLAMRPRQRAEHTSAIKVRSPESRMPNTSYQPRGNVTLLVGDNLTATNKPQWSQVTPEAWAIAGLSDDRVSALKVQHYGGIGTVDHATPDDAAQWTLVGVVRHIGPTSGLQKAQTAMLTLDVLPVAAALV
jgi:hypothetical protein